MTMAKGTTTKRPRWRLALGALLAILASAMPAALAQDSIEALRAEAEASAEDPRAWVRLGNAHYQGNDFEGAKDAYLEAVSVDYLSCDGHYGLGLAEFGRGDHQAALFAFNEVTRLCAERFDGHYNRAVTLARLERPADAAEAYRAALDEAEPEADTEDRVAAWRGLARVRTDMGDHGAAAEAYAGALNLRPTDEALVLAQGEALHRAGRGLEALSDLTSLEGRSDDYRISALIADIYVEAGQVDYAERALERALRRAEGGGKVPAQASLHVELGLFLRDVGRTDEALEHFRAASELEPDNWQALYNLGVGHLDVGDTTNALETLRRADALEGSGGRVALALASALDQAAEAQEAANAAARALESLEDEEMRIDAHFLLGRNAYRVVDYTTARDSLQRVVDARPDSASAQLWMGLTLYQQGNYEASVPYYERAVQLAPNDVSARLNLGAAYLASQRYEDAEVVYASLVEQDPQDAESRYNLGWSLLSQNEREPTRDAWGESCDMGFQPACDALVEYF